MTTVEKYGVAYAVTVDNLKMLFQEGILVDNIPRLMMHIGKTMPGSVVRKIAEASEKEKQEAFDTHPPTRERIRAAQELNKPGIVRVGRPARDLIDHWQDLCQQITLVFYSHVTGEEVKPNEAGRAGERRTKKKSNKQSGLFGKFGRQATWVIHRAAMLTLRK